MKDERGREVVFKHFDYKKEEERLMENEGNIQVIQVATGKVKVEELELIMLQLIHEIKKASPDMPLAELKTALADAIIRHETKKEGEKGKS